MHSLLENALSILSIKKWEYYLCSGLNKSFTVFTGVNVETGTSTVESCKIGSFKASLNGTITGTSITRVPMNLSIISTVSVVTDGIGGSNDEDVCGGGFGVLMVEIRFSINLIMESGYTSLTII